MNIRITRELLDDWNMRIGMGQDVNIEIPYAQAEIAKRDKRIKELEQQIARLKTVPMKYRRMEFNAQLQRENTEQAAEISRLRLVIAELEEEDGLLCDACMGTGGLENREDGKYPCTCVSETEPYQILVQQNSEQASEITRLKVVIGKCACSLRAITKRANYLDVLDIAREANEALAKIKAQGNCIQYGEAGQSAKYYRLLEGD